jgi:hypothetical protein
MQLRKHWRAIGGAILMCWKPVEWLLQQGEHIEYVFHNWPHAIRLVAAMYSAIPSWVGWLIPAIGIGFLTWDHLWFRRRKAAQGDVLSATGTVREVAATPSQQTESPVLIRPIPAAPEPTELKPNWPLRELAFNIDPQLRINPAVVNRQKIVSEIASQAARGNLQTWSRAGPDQFAPIKAGAWQQTGFAL